jgi:Glycosyl transferase family 2
MEGAVPFRPAMRLVQTLVVRDEADIVDAQLAYHLNAGVDFVIATDHESQDGTTEILETYARAGYLRRIPQSGWNEEAAWRTRMARMAATEHGADWVINTDADEFWMPRRGTLKELFAAVPAEFGVVWALSRQFVPRPDSTDGFAERMVVRLSSVAAINDPTSPYRPHAKAAHRGDPDIVVRHGGHAAVSPRFPPLPEWYPADVLHFPFRFLEQYERKCVRRAQADKPLGQYVRAFEAHERGRIVETYRSLVVEDETLERGRRTGSLTVDVRLRDALRAIDANGSSTARPSATRRFRLPAPGKPDSRFPPTATTEADTDVVAEGAALNQAELVRLTRSVDGLRERLRPVEQRVWARGRAVGREASRVPVR